MGGFEYLGNNSFYIDPGTGEQITREEFFTRNGVLPTDINIVFDKSYQNTSPQSGRGAETLPYVQPNLFVGQ